jgi:hypothetical protein
MGVVAVVVAVDIMVVLEAEVTEVHTAGGRAQAIQVVKQGTRALAGVLLIQMDSHLMAEHLVGNLVSLFQII